MSRHDRSGDQLSEVSDYFSSVHDVLTRMPLREIDRLVEVLHAAHNRGAALFLFGNGGSAALASHMACDLGKGTSDLCPVRMRALSLTDNVPLITAWGNDTAYEHVFAEQLKNFITCGDIAFAISGSGNSPNVLNALRVARSAGAVTVGITGFQGGKMRELCDVCVVVPSNNMQVIEDIHVITAHGVFTALRARMRNPGVLAASAD